MIVELLFEAAALARWRDWQSGAEMKISKVLAGFALSVSMLMGAPSYAQAPKPPETTTPAPKPENKDPCPIPYAVGAAVKGGELETRFGSSAFKKLSAVPDIEARGGLEVVRTAYAGMTSQAMEAVLGSFACRIKAYIDKTHPADAAAKAAAVDKAISDLSFELAMVQSASAESAAALATIKDGYMDKDTRRPNAPTLDPQITRAALQDVDPTKLFISQDQVKFWGGLDVGPYVGVQACGGVVHAAISDGGSSLQVSLSKAKSILINYLDPNTPPNVALASLFVSGAASPIKKSTTDAVSFRDCTKNVAAKVASSASIAPPLAQASSPVATDPAKPVEQAKNN